MWMPGEMERWRGYFWIVLKEHDLKQLSQAVNCEKNFQLPFITLKKVKGITACKFIIDSCQGTEDEN